MPQFPECLRFDLPDALTGHVVHLADFFQGSFVAIHQAETHLQDLALTFGEARQHIAKLLLQQTVAGDI